MCGNHQDNDDGHKTCGITRRGFMQYMGAGAVGISVGATMAVRVPKAESSAQEYGSA